MCGVGVCGDVYVFFDYFGDWWCCFGCVMFIVFDEIFVLIGYVMLDCDVIV